MQLYHIILLATFIAALLAVEAIYGFWNATSSPEAKQIIRRLRLMSAEGREEENISILKKRQYSSMPAVERLLHGLPGVHPLDRLLEQAGSNLSVASLLSLMVLCFLAGLALGWKLSGFWLFGAFAGVAIGSLPLLFIVRAKTKRMHAMLLQLPDALDLMARSMRAGHAFSGGMKMVADEMPDPIAAEFRHAFEELNYGLPLESVMHNLAERVDIPDMKYFVISVLIQRETGGNLAGILEKIGSLIRERLKLLGRVRVLSSQGRLEAWILSVLPFVVAAIMFAIWPQFMAILWTEAAGKVMIGVAGAMLLIGVAIMWRMVRIRI